jgi:TRAP transporter TAXI family solute receptor
LEFVKHRRTALIRSDAGLWGVVLRTSSLIAGLVLIAFGAGAAPKVKAETAWLGLVAGPPAASETVQAADMASLFEKDRAFRVVPMLGDASAGNIALLLNDPSVDVAFVSIDALSAAAATDPTLSQRLELVARLAPQEIHVLARTEIGSLGELAGKKVSFGPPGSSSAATATALFNALGIAAEPERLDASAAIERLKQGTIDAVVIVGGKPYPLISAIPTSSGIHLLPVPFGAPLEAAYLPTHLEQRDYPNLIQPGGEVPTVATGAVLLAAKGDPRSAERVAHFVEKLFPRFAELQVADRHPKWREVNLAAALPGFSRTEAAAAWLNARTAQTGTKPIVRGKPWRRSARRDA